MKSLSLVTSLLLPVIFALSIDVSAAQAAQRREEPVNPMYEMFRNFMGQLPNNFVDPANFIPGGGAYPMGPYGPGTFNPYVGGPFVPGAGGIPSFMPQGDNQDTSVSFGSYGNTDFPILNGLGYSGPIHGSEAGIPNPNYGTIGAGFGAAAGAGADGNVPIVSTRVNAGGSRGAEDPLTSVVKTNDGSQVAVAVRNSPDGRPVFRSETVQGPNNSYGTAFAYST